MKGNLKDPKLTYALDALGKMIYIGNVEKRGLSCNCRCPKCNEPLEAKLGHEGGRQAHFAHSSSHGDRICPNDYEKASPLHFRRRRLCINRTGGRPRASSHYFLVIVHVFASPSYKVANPAIPIPIVIVGSVTDVDNIVVMGVVLALTAVALMKLLTMPVADL